MANARVIEAADAAVALIQTAWGPTPPSGVQRAYLNQRISLSGEDAADLLQGRQVYVFPFAPLASRVITRADLWRSYLLRVLVVERYADAAAPDVPADWVDERVAFTEQTVFDLLTNPSLKLVGQMTPDPEQEATIDELAPRDLLVEHKAFWSYMTLPFVEPTDLTGAHP